MWELIKIERSSPFSIKSLSISNNSSLAITSNPAVGSSRINNFALCETATKTFTFAFIPVEKSFILLFRGSWNFLTCSIKNDLSKFWYKLSIIGIISLIVKYPLKPESERTTPKSCLSFAVKSCNDFPRILIVPLSKEISPKIALNVVLFPAPFWPIKPVTWPFFTSREQSSEKFS